jgi:proteasome lid subunit RPN8/RPN11
MKGTTRHLIAYHALEDPSVEACGFIINAGGFERVVRARNAAPDPSRFFVIHPDDYAAAEKVGRIIAIYHSHPKGPSEPSAGDRAACTASGLPWYIYSVPDHSFAAIDPDDFPAPLVGREFLWGINDCGTLVRDYYREKLGINLVYEPYPERFWKDPNHKPYLRKFLENGFRIVNAPKEHDCLLLQLSADEPNHAAIYINGGLILHHVQNRLSCRDVYGGYWREVTRYVLRHESLMENL